MNMNEWEKKLFDDYVKNGTFYIYYQRASQSGMNRYYKVFIDYDGRVRDITYFINYHFYNSDKREIKITGCGTSGELEISINIKRLSGQSINWYTL